MKRSTPGGRQARVALVGLVLVMLGGLGMVALASAQGLPPPGPRPMMAGPAPGLGVPMLDALHCDRLPPELQLSETQRDKLRAIADGLHAAQVQRRDADRALADRWAGLLSAPTVDAQAAEALRAQMEQVHEAMSRRLLQATLDTAAVLTPAQRAQLVRLSQAAVGRGEPGDREEGPGPGLPGMPPPPFLVQ